MRLSDVGKVNSPGSGGKGGSGPDYQDYAVTDRVTLAPREVSYPTVPGNMIEPGGASPKTLASAAVLTALVLPGVASQRAGSRVFVRGDAEMRLELQATYPRAKTVGAGAIKQRAELGIGVRACVTARCGNAPKNAAQQQMMGQEMIAEMMRAQQGGPRGPTGHDAEGAGLPRTAGNNDPGQLQLDRADPGAWRPRWLRRPLYNRRWRSLYRDAQLQLAAHVRSMTSGTRWRHAAPLPHARIVLAA